MSFKVKRVLKEVIRDKVVDFNTGEIVQETMQQKYIDIALKSKDDFFFVYASIVGLMEDLDGASVKLLQYLALNAQFNTNMISISKSTCMDIESKTGLKYQTIKNCVYKLKKLKVLIPLGAKDAMYRINPLYYWKGERDERVKTMSFVLTVECPDCMNE